MEDVDGEVWMAFSLKSLGEVGDAAAVGEDTGFTTSMLFFSGCSSSTISSPIGLGASFSITASSMISSSSFSFSFSFRASFAKGAKEGLLAAGFSFLDCEGLGIAEVAFIGEDEVGDTGVGAATEVETEREGEGGEGEPARSPRGGARVGAEEEGEGEGEGAGLRERTGLLEGTVEMGEGDTRERVGLVCLAGEMDLFFASSTDAAAATFF